MQIGAAEQNHTQAEPKINTIKRNLFRISLDLTSVISAIAIPTFAILTLLNVTGATADRDTCYAMCRQKYPTPCPIEKPRVLFDPLFI